MPPFLYSWTKQQDAVDFPAVSAERDEFILEDGRRVYDFVSTSFQANFGYSFEPIKRRINEQLERLPMASPKATFALKSRASQKLIELLGFPDGKVFYTVSGAEAVENALKIARQYTGRTIIAARQKSYHGASLGALSVTGDWRSQPHWTWDAGTLRIPEHETDPDLTETRRRMQDIGPTQLAGIILETISGTNGMAIPSLDWFQQVRALCDEFGLLLIVDEVLVGFGRCGSHFAFQDYGIQPDLVCLSKAITGGYIPFGAVWLAPHIARHYDDRVLACGLTNYGHPLGLAAMEAVIDTLNDASFQADKRDLQNHFANEVSTLASHPRVIETRCRGLMAAIYLDGPAPRWQTAFAHGLHLFSKDNYSIFGPAYITSSEKLTNAFAVYRSLLETDSPA